ncbi:uncharacterized protein LOC120104129 [Phoenix dactylifera]|uniref:Uncharacterized protein LOC120104129 n=1 Tax=Phoenix dactylifera TaxID=42345 RepID=A0A8B8ZFF8_PHODC|nr:uncharacterized protein LOC120104129 [Phoenix dactylifera]
MSQIEPYNGTTDPLDHLESYQALMALQGSSEVVLCKAFSAILRGTARLWFSGLKPSTVSSFEQLGRQFATNFVASRRQQRTSDFLLDIKQKEGESLKDYINRFTAATSEVCELDQSIAMSTLKTEARSNRFLFFIEKNFSADFTEMLARARKYAKAEEAIASRRSATEQASKKQKRHREERGRPRSRSPHLRSPPRQRAQPRPRSPPWPRSPSRQRIPLERYENYTPLNTPRTEILIEIEGRNYLQPPPPMRKSELRCHFRKYCRFHRDHVRDTNECFQLRDEIEALIHHGVLNRFVQSQRDERRSEENDAPPEGPNDNRPIAGTINPIGRGSAEGSSAGESAEGRIPPKRQCTSEAISFLDEDLKGVEIPHDDAVIGSSLSSHERNHLIKFLHSNMDVFAWSPMDMPGIDPDVMVHRLQVKPTCKPVRQKKWISAPERQRAAAEEVDKLLEASFI